MGSQLSANPHSELKKKKLKNKLKPFSLLFTSEKNCTIQKMLLASEILWQQDFRAIVRIHAGLLFSFGRNGG